MQCRATCPQHSLQQGADQRSLGFRQRQHVMSAPCIHSHCSCALCQQKFPRHHKPGMHVCTPVCTLDQIERQQMSVAGRTDLHWEELKQGGSQNSRRSSACCSHSCAAAVGRPPKIQAIHLDHQILLAWSYTMALGTLDVTKEMHHMQPAKTACFMRMHPTTFGLPPPLTHGVGSTF